MKSRLLQVAALVLCAASVVAAVRVTFPGTNHARPLADVVTGSCGSDGGLMVLLHGTPTSAVAVRTNAGQRIVSMTLSFRGVRKTVEWREPANVAAQTLAEIIGESIANRLDPAVGYIK